MYFIRYNLKKSNSYKVITAMTNAINRVLALECVMNLDPIEYPRGEITNKVLTDEERDNKCYLEVILPKLQNPKIAIQEFEEITIKVE